MSLIFFDLEFYVPPNDRTTPETRGTFKYTPTKPTHILLGGYFKITDIKMTEIFEEKGLWIWQYSSEKDLLKEIYHLFDQAWHQKQKHAESTPKILHKRVKDLITVGTAIARIDLPILYIRSQTHKIAPTTDLYRRFLCTKVIDLSNTASFLFPQESVMYPKTQREIATALLGHSNQKSPGSDVWNMYDNGDLEAIESRCKSEVREIYTLYQEMKKVLSNQERT